MNNHRVKVLEAVSYIKEKIKPFPLIGILTGTGLGDITESINIRASLNYKDIPNFPVSTVQSHDGILEIGDISGKEVIAFKGRFHLYEGYSPLEVTFPIRVMQELGVKILILFNAAGGLNPAFKQGDIMAISDHINLTGRNPLVGTNEETWGLRFPDMLNAYDKKLTNLAHKAADKIDNKLVEGVYAGLLGPSLETPAEIKFLRTIGVDAVGFSTVQEVIAAIHGSMKVLGLSTITNINAVGNFNPASIEEIIETAKKAAPVIGKIITEVAKNIN
ncbi:MAG: purine-nucleoside phosphorylase [Desulfobacterales bacterium]|nr:purine-nucleoside phosphorylase [Desulfobacterales bacterium]